MKLEPWHESLIESLSWASDIDLQRREWTDNFALTVGTPTELVCQIFDDSGVGDLLELGFAFSDDIDGVLRRMSSLVPEIDLEQSPESLLMDLKWKNFCELSSVALAGIKKLFD